jgi:hypothetical protein
VFSTISAVICVVGTSKYVACWCAEKRILQLGDCGRRLIWIGHKDPQSVIYSINAPETELKSHHTPHDSCLDELWVGMNIVEHCSCIDL